MEITEFKRTSTAFLLTGFLGKYVYKEYRRLVDERYQKNKQLLIRFTTDFERYDLMIDEESGTIEGCGPFSMCIVNEILEKRNLRVADLFCYRELCSLGGHINQSLSRNHLNFGLVLIGDKKIDLSREDGYHRGTKYLKEGLKRQILDLGYDMSLPIYIPYSSLSLKLDANSPFGISFELANKPVLQPLAIFKGKNDRMVRENFVLHVAKTEKQGLHMCMLYLGVGVLRPQDMDDILKPHYSIGIKDFDKISGSYGRIFVVSKDSSFPGGEIKLLEEG